MLVLINGNQLDVYKEEKDKAKGITKEEPDPDAEEKSLLMQILPSLMIIGFFNIMPIVFICVLRNKRVQPHLSTAAMKEKIGNMYATVDPSVEGSLYYNVVFLFRRSSYVAITFSLFNFPGIQIQAFMYVTMFYMMYIHHYPKYSETLTLKSETFNEIMFLLICYHMVLFSNLVWNPEMKQQIG